MNDDGADVAPSARSPGEALSLDRSAAAVIISAVPGRRRRCLIAGVPLTWRRQTALIRPIVAADDMYFSKWREQVGNRSEEIIGMIRKG